MHGSAPPTRCLVLVAKQPVAGRVKTRLAAAIGAERARELYEAFLRDTVETCSQVADCTLCFSFAPAAAEDWFRELDAEALLYAQPEAPFGERLTATLEQVFALGFREVLMIGGDTPQLGRDALLSAFGELRDHDGVVGPAGDGGYYLIGLRAPSAVLFEDIAWSTDRVLAQTLERARASGIDLALLPRVDDVDKVADLLRLQRELTRADPASCPRTRRLLDTLDQA